MINKIFTEYRISDIGQVIGGGTPSTSIDEYWNGNIPWISPKDLTNYNCVYISCGENFISEKGLNKSGTKLLPENTVLFSSRAPIGYVAIAANSICTNQGFKSIICDPDRIDYLYLYYYLKANLEYIKLFANGATFPELSGKAMKNIKINIFNDVKYQRKIADTLFKYDNLIENNNKRIKSLEQMAENLYKEWFVRFRFPGYENAEFENGIPKGWEILKVKNICRVKSGFAFKSQWWQDIGIPVIKIKDIKDNTIDLNDLSYVSKENADKAKQFYVNAGDLLIAMTGATIGKIALVPHTFKITVNQRVGKFFLGKNPLEYSPFLFCLFLQEQIQEQITQIASSNAAQPNISPFDIEKLKFVGEMHYISKFNKLTEPMFKEILTLRAKNKNLTQQRDLLLPQLMSGKLEVE